MESHEASETPDLPLYNIGAVARMTGVSIDTLRVWERLTVALEGSAR